MGVNIEPGIENARMQDAKGNAAKSSAGLSNRDRSIKLL